MCLQVLADKEQLIGRVKNRAGVKVNSVRQMAVDLESSCPLWSQWPWGQLWEQKLSLLVAVCLWQSHSPCMRFIAAGRKTERIYTSNHYPAHSGLSDWLLQGSARKNEGTVLTHKHILFIYCFLTQFKSCLSFSFCHFFMLVILTWLF